MKKTFIMLSVLLSSLTIQAAEPFVSFKKDIQYFPLAENGTPCNILASAQEMEGVRMAMENLAEDIKKVCGKQPVLKTEGAQGRCLIIGSIGTPLIQSLIKKGKIDGKELAGKNEKYLLQVVDNPSDGVEEALVIAGSDKRGTVYGIYELAEQIGVSPWNWWADVPVTTQENIYIKPGVYTDGEPKVEYRGIFLNDEWPCLGNWANEKFKGFNSKFYKKVFELVLRLRGNFMWPAMWGSAFYDDDPQNGILADKMGIVMGTSHHEPMAAAQKDWSRRRNGAWNYQTNSKALKEFWTFSAERAKDWETAYTVGMRGDGDEPMSEDANVDLLLKIVKDQRKILKKVTGKKPEDILQVWALYKEVQDYYDKGMRVPDDITLLLCDDNWGNVRKLPGLDEKPRKGGYGMYYHFDYVGGPRNSKWINISPIPRIWEQLNLTYEHGVRKLWIVNVGDLKPMEYPITFFMDMAWNPERFNAQNLQQHTVDFCRQQFGDNYTEEIACILNTYPKYNRRVTPEVLDADTYTFNYGEWDKVRDEYNALALKALSIGYLMPEQYRATYDQLISFPVQACANLYNMYYAQAQNKRLAAERNPEANRWADRVEACFKRDAELTDYYHRRISDGKWNHLMGQVHIGYTSWNNPEKQVMPAVTRIAVEEERPEYVFEEKNGYIAMEAEHWTRAVADGKTQWSVIPDFGKTLSGVTTLPVTETPEEMFLEYDMETEHAGKVCVELALAPTLNFNHNRGLRYAISFDGGTEQVVNFNGHYKGELDEWQRNHIILSRTVHELKEAGRHTLRIRPLDPGIVIERIQIDAGGLKKTYLGAPETLKEE